MIMTILLGAWVPNYECKTPSTMIGLNDTADV